ncbi:MAG: hypothetical protein KC561_02045 [Myxococcales bacterium]|nr:hypothetical protein [Myxococcales bacterium]
MKDDPRFAQLIEAIERGISKTLAEEKGVELGPDGKVDFTKLNKNEFVGRKDLVLASLKAALEDMVENEVFIDNDSTPPEKPLIEKLAEESGKKGVELEKSASRWFAEKFGFPLNEDGTLDGEKMRSESFQAELLERYSDVLPWLTALFSSKGRPVKPTDSNPDGESEEQREADVIDLDDWRQRIKERQVKALNMGEGLAGKIGEFIQSRARPGAGGNVNLSMDQSYFQAFLREHGPDMWREFVQNVGKNLVPPKIELNLPAAEAKPAPEAAVPPVSNPESGSAGKESKSGEGVKIALNFDFGSLFKGFLKTTPQASPEPSEAVKPSGGPAKEPSSDEEENSSSETPPESN